MKHCKHCDGEVSADAKFCRHCGKSLTDDTSDSEQQEEDVPHSGEEEESNRDTLETMSDELQDEATPVQEDPEQEDTEETDAEEAKATTSSTLEDQTPKEGKSGKQPFNKIKEIMKIKKSNLLIYSSVAIIIILIGIYAIFNNLSSEKHALDDFETAIKDGDAKQLSKLLIAEDENLEINEDSVQGLIDLYEAKPSELKFLMSHLQIQASGEDMGINMYPIDFVKDGKRFLLFDDYAFQVNPIYFKVHTNYKDTDIIVNGEKVATADKENFDGEIGPFIPGEYTIKAVFDTGFFNLDKSEKASNTDPGHAPYVDLNLEADKVSFDLYANNYNDLNSVKLFVNGKDTKWDLAKEDRVGPLLTDGTMNASFEAELPWGTVKTNEIPIDSRYLDFNLGDSEELKQEMMDIIVQYNEEFLEAITSGDASKLKTAPLLQEELMADEAVDMEENIEYKGSFHGVDFYLDSFNLEKTYDDFWKITVDTITYFEEALYEKGDEQKLEKVEEEMRYELAYDQQGKAWVIIGLDYPGAMDEDNMERFKAKDPKVYTSDWGKKDKKKKD